MDAIDIEAKTIDEAIEKACREFKTTREKLKIEIIAEGNPGFLGFGSRKALIRAGILQIDRELDDLLNSAGTPVSAMPPKTPPAPLAVSTPAPEKKKISRPSDLPLPARSGGSLPVDFSEQAKTEPENNSTGKTPNIRQKQERPRRSNASDGSFNQKHPKAKRPDHEPPSQEAAPTQPETVKALELVEGILSRMNIPAVVKLQEENDTVILKIQGDGDGLLIGKRGQNLDAIQYIVNKAVHHSINEGRRIVIDTEEYRKRREDSLLSTALQTAQKVRKTRKPITLGPMNPHDRRIIHIALKNDRSLTTISRGEGEYRKIVIVPARQEPAAENPVAANSRDEE
ncbi:MAG: RNA-binding cell elongation regulator Jag/EloR [Syntrophales bacterium]